MKRTMAAACRRPRQNGAKRGLWGRNSALGERVARKRQGLFQPRPRHSSILRAGWFFCGDIGRLLEPKQELK
jgi:hypothetical protein